MSLKAERHGDAFIFTWPEHGIGVGVNHLRESSDGLHAEITVESILSGATGRLHGPARLNLVSTQSQTALASALKKREPKVQWDSILVQVCAKVAEAWREGSPVINLAEVEDPGPVKYLVEGFLPERETTILYGDGEGGKSLLALLTAICCATGQPLPWGARPARQVPVLILDWETNQAAVGSRLRRLVRGLGLPNLPSIHYRQQLRSLEDDSSAIKGLVAELGIGLVIIDSLSFACSGSLNEDQTARGAMNALRSLSPATRLAVAHISRESAHRQNGGTDPFGSIFFRNGMRSGWEVRKGEAVEAGAVEVGLFHRKHNDGERHKPFSLRLAFDGPTGPINVGLGNLTENPELAAHASLPMRIREALRRGSLDSKELAEAAGSKVEVVVATARRMKDVTKLEGGLGRGNVARWGLLASGEKRT